MTLVTSHKLYGRAVPYGVLLLEADQRGDCYWTRLRVRLRPSILNTVQGLACRVSTVVHASGQTMVRSYCMGTVSRSVCVRRIMVSCIHTWSTPTYYVESTVFRGLVYGRIDTVGQQVRWVYGVSRRVGSDISEAVRS